MILEYRGKQGTSDGNKTGLIVTMLSKLILECYQNYRDRLLCVDDIDRSRKLPMPIPIYAMLSQKFPTPICANAVL